MLHLALALTAIASLSSDHIVVVDACNLIPVSNLLIMIILPTIGAQQIWLLH